MWRKSGNRFFDNNMPKKFKKLSEWQCKKANKSGLFGLIEGQFRAAPF
ncbi:hypothetical protein CES85_5055 [Ochrobactrum quorumnocens]|uniref:Uncharacterized protein n=1 Tax=Ochrobactrum quorumnocens TaxID=271865 RepID=A0A248UBU6_9HYPH|nr:hypothetical protein CES85_5055 [[Ochrobactrum] quorumnocens]